MPSLPLSLIYEPHKRIRALQPDAVAILANSMGRIGLKTPITVRATQRIRDGQLADVWEIVAGCHRVEAAKRLGWAEIEAVIFDGPEADARLWAIAENLRAELTVQERAELIAEWITLTGERIDATCANSSKPGPKGAIRAAGRELGVDRTEAQRAVKIASIAPAAREITKDTSIEDNQSALLRIAREPTPEKQVAAARQEVETRQSRPVPPPREPQNDIEVTNKQVDALMRAWNGASREARERFLEMVDRPVFDNTRSAA